jgi:hypothetical protein
LCPFQFPEFSARFIVVMEKGTHAYPCTPKNWAALTALALAGEFEVLLLDDLSRLSREQVESESTIRRLEHNGIGIIAVSDGYDSLSKGRRVYEGDRERFERARCPLSWRHLAPQRSAARRPLARIGDWPLCLESQRTSSWPD